MASTALQVVGFVLGVLSWIGMIGTCASPEWRKNSHGQTLIDNTIRYDGLWYRCKAFSTGQTHCDDYNEFFIGLPGVLQVCRALMIASIAIGFIAIVVTIIGIKCTSIGSASQKTKARIAMVGGLLFGVAAILVGSSVSYYAHGVVQEYYNPVLEKDMPMHLRFEYGSALFVGWASLVVGLLGGIILCFTSVFVIMRLNMANRRGRSKPGTRVHGGNTQQDHAHLIQKQQHLPMAQQRSAHNRQVRMLDDGALTKQRIAMHNAKISSKNGHNHHAEPGGRKHSNNSLADSSKSSNEKPKRYSGKDQRRQHSSDLPDGAAGHTGIHHHHHHTHASKSDSIAAKSRTKDTEHDRRHRHENPDDNNVYERPRPVKEYV